MRESYGEGVATHTGPESCVGVREGVGEALTGVRAGQPLSREIRCFRGAHTVRRVEGNTEGAAMARRPSTPRGLRPCACTETLHAGSGRSHNWPGVPGPRREPKGYDGDARSWEVGRAHSTEEPREQGQRCAAACGVRGGKGPGQRESDSRRQVPDTVPGRPECRHGWDAVGDVSGRANALPGQGLRV